MASREKLKHITETLPSVDIAQTRSLLQEQFMVAFVAFCNMQRTLKGAPQGPITTSLMADFEKFDQLTREFFLRTLEMMGYGHMEIAAALLVINGMARLE